MAVTTPAFEADSISAGALQGILQTTRNSFGLHRPAPSSGGPALVPPPCSRNPAAGHDLPASGGSGGAL